MRDMEKLIDADALMRDIEQYHLSDGKFQHWVEVQPTVDAVPTEFVMENFNLELICDELTDDGEWCSEHCQYSEPQRECIHRYIEKIWRKEHDKID